ncbi:MAG: DUF805 domain-containing protein [Albidovulum sp.]
MTLVEAAKEGFRNYVNFSGRSPRALFWKFVLFLLLVHIALVIINSVIFGPTVSDILTVRVDQSGAQTQFTGHQAVYDGGWLGTIFGLATILPLLAAGWRRMHDIGRSGWFLLLPVAAIAVAFLTIHLGSEVVAIDLSKLPAGADFPETMRMPRNAFVVLIPVLLTFAAMGTVIWWLARRSQSGPNRYGPNPHEVPQ